MKAIKRILFAYALLAAFFIALPSVPSCAHVAQPAEGCAREVTADLIKTVASDLARADYDDALKAVEASVGLCALKVAVQDAENAAASDSAALAAHDPTATAIVAHAQAWLAAHGGPPVSTTTIKAGLPGGGHNCCMKPGFWSTIPSCGPPISLTSANLASHCGCAPIQLWC